MVCFDSPKAAVGILVKSQSGYKHKKAREKLITY